MTCYVAAKARFGAPINSEQGPKGPLHAYVNGEFKTFCGLSLGSEVLMFVQMKWADRPPQEAVCVTCSAQAA